MKEAKVTSNWLKETKYVVVSQPTEYTPVKSVAIDTLP